MLELTKTVLFAMLDNRDGTFKNSLNKPKFVLIFIRIIRRRGKLVFRVPFVGLRELSSLSSLGKCIRV